MDSISPSPCAAIAVVLRHLRGALGGWGVRGLLPQALLLLLFARLEAVAGRIERLGARFLAGRVWRRAPSVSAARVVPEAGAADRVRVPRLWPGRFAWLVRSVGWEAAGYGSQLRAVLETPEMVAMLIEVPQAARLLAPLCRMLAVERPVLHPGVPVVAPVARVATKRVRAKRPPINWGRIPLPRGVLSAARRAGFKTVR